MTFSILKKPKYHKISKLVLFVALISVFSYFLNFYFDSHSKYVEFNDKNYNLIIESPIMNYSEPIKLSIPRINLNTDFEAPLGINANKEVEPPKSFDHVGWYKYSPPPGSLGPSVVLGHVDSKNGPAIFFSLGQLEIGDDIFIDRSDGSVVHFKVDFLERYEQKEFPTEKVYGNINHAGLRLVTCSGIYLRGQQRYTHNLVVYASLVE